MSFEGAIYIKLLTVVLITLPLCYSGVIPNESGEGSFSSFTRGDATADLSMLPSTAFTDFKKRSLEEKWSDNESEQNNRSLNEDVKISNKDEVNENSTTQNHGISRPVSNKAQKLLSNIKTILDDRIQKKKGISENSSAIENVNNTKNISNVDNENVGKMQIKPVHTTFENNTNSDTNDFDIVEQNLNNEPIKTIIQPYESNKIGGSDAENISSIESTDSFVKEFNDRNSNETDSKLVDNINLKPFPKMENSTGVGNTEDHPVGANSSEIFPTLTSDDNLSAGKVSENIKGLAESENGNENSDSNSTIFNVENDDFSSSSSNLTSNSTIHMKNNEVTNNIKTQNDNNNSTMNREDGNSIEVPPKPVPLNSKNSLNNTDPDHSLNINTTSLDDNMNKEILQVEPPSDMFTNSSLEAGTSVTFNSTVNMEKSGVSDNDKIIAKSEKEIDNSTINKEGNNDFSSGSLPSRFNDALNNTKPVYNLNTTSDGIVNMELNQDTLYTEGPSANNFTNSTSEGIDKTKPLDDLSSLHENSKNLSNKTNPDQMLNMNSTSSVNSTPKFNDALNDTKPVHNLNTTSDGIVNMELNQDTLYTAGPSANNVTNSTSEGIDKTESLDDLSSQSSLHENSKNLSNKTNPDQILNVNSTSGVIKEEETGEVSDSTIESINNKEKTSEENNNSTLVGEQDGSDNNDHNDDFLSTSLPTTNESPTNSTKTTFDNKSNNTSFFDNSTEIGYNKKYVPTKPSMDDLILTRAFNEDGVFNSNFSSQSLAVVPINNTENSNITVSNDTLEKDMFYSDVNNVQENNRTGTVNSVQNSETETDDYDDESQESDESDSETHMNGKNNTEKSLSSIQDEEELVEQSDEFSSRSLPMNFINTKHNSKTKSSNKKEGNLSVESPNSDVNNNDELEDDMYSRSFPLENKSDKQESTTYRAGTLNYVQNYGTEIDDYSDKSQESDSETHMNGKNKVEESLSERSEENKMDEIDSGEVNRDSTEDESEERFKTDLNILIENIRDQIGNQNVFEKEDKNLSENLDSTENKIVGNFGLRASNEIKIEDASNEQIDRNLYSEENVDKKSQTFVIAPKNKNIKIAIDIDLGDMDGKEERTKSRKIQTSSKENNDNHPYEEALEKLNQILEVSEAILEIQKKFGNINQPKLSVSLRDETVNQIPFDKKNENTNNNNLPDECDETNDKSSKENVNNHQYNIKSDNDKNTNNIEGGYLSNCKGIVNVEDQQSISNPDYDIQENNQEPYESKNNYYDDSKEQNDLSSIINSVQKQNIENKPNYHLYHWEQLGNNGYTLYGNNQKYWIQLPQNQNNNYDNSYTNSYQTPITNSANYPYYNTPNYNDLSQFYLNNLYSQNSKPGYSRYANLNYNNDNSVLQNQYSDLYNAYTTNENYYNYYTQ